MATTVSAAMTTGLVKDTDKAAKNGLAALEGNVPQINSAGKIPSQLLSTGVHLGGTAAANLLDDYEEGTFTLSMNGFSFQTNSQGRYIKIGKCVHFTAFIHASGSQNANEAALTLPFAIGTSTESGNTGYRTLALAVTSPSNVDTGSIGVTGIGFGGTSIITLFKQDEDGGRTAMTNDAFTSEDTMFLSGMYITN